MVQSALTATLAFPLPVFLGGVEPVIVRLELLTLQIALALDGLADFGVYAQQVVDPPADAFDEAVVRIEVARIGGAKAAVITDFVKRGGPCFRIDHAAQPFAFRHAQEIAHREELGLVGIDLVDTRIRGEPFANLLAHAL